MGDYSDRAVKKHRNPFAYVTVGGIGHVKSSGASPTKLSTWKPTGSYQYSADGYRSYLKDWPRWDYDGINPPDGSSDPGSLEFTAVDASDNMTSQLAYLKGGIPASGVAGEFPTMLTAAITRSATTLTVNNAGSVAIGDMIFVDAEAMYVSNVVSTTVTVVRAQWHTKAAQHPRESLVRATPSSLSGQLVTLTRGHIPHATDTSSVGTPVAIASPTDVLGIALNVAGDLLWHCNPAAGTIAHYTLAGASLTNVITGLGGTGPSGIGLDITNGTIYYSLKDSNKIRKANADGTGDADFATGLGDPYRIEVDEAAGQVYWADQTSQKVQRQTTGAGGVGDIVTGEAGIYGLALDLTNSHIYWSTESGATIRRSSLTGTNKTTILSAGKQYRGIDVDPASQKIYFCNTTDGTIQSCDYDGSNVTTLVSGLTLPDSCELDSTNNELYYSDATDNTIAKIAVANNEESVRWRGYLKAVSQTDDGLAWRLSATSLLSGLNVECMRRLGRYKYGSGAGSAHGLSFEVTPDDNAESRFADTQQNIYVAGSEQSGVLYVDKGSATNNPEQLKVNLSDASLNHAALRLANVDEWRETGSGGQLWEVAPTDPAMPNTRFGYYTSGSSYVTFVETSHPFLIALCWMLSVLGDNASTRNADSGVNSYDVLPEGWGAELSSSHVDVPSFERAALRHPISNPNFVYGINGEAFNLKKHIEDELIGPYGYMITQVDGKLTLVSANPEPDWMTSSSQTVSHSQILDGTSLSNSVPLDDRIQTCTVKSGYDWMREKFLARTEAHQNRRQAWIIQGGRSVEWELHGFKPGDASVASVVKAIATQYLMKHGRVLPMMTIDLDDTYEHRINIGDTINVTSSHVSDLANGVRGVTVSTYVVWGKTGMDQGRVAYTLSSQNGRINVASIAPAVKIASVTSTTQLEITKSTSDFSVSGYPSIDGWGPVPGSGITEDIDWFRFGAAATGDIVIVLNGATLAPRFPSPGQVFNDAQRISNISDNTTTWKVTLASALSGSPSVGDYLVPAEIDATDVTAKQKQFAYLASNGRLETGFDQAPYVYVE